MVRNNGPKKIRRRSAQNSGAPYSSMPRAIKCQVCNNKTRNPSGFCYLHENAHGASQNVDPSILSGPSLSTSNTDDDRDNKGAWINDDRFIQDIEAVDENGDELTYLSGSAIIADSLDSLGYGHLYDEDEEERLYSIVVYPPDDINSRIPVNDISMDCGEPIITPSDNLRNSYQKYEDDRSYDALYTGDELIVPESDVENVSQRLKDDAEKSGVFKKVQSELDEAVKARRLKESVVPNYRSDNSKDRGPSVFGHNGLTSSYAHRQNEFEMSTSVCDVRWTTPNTVEFDCDGNHYMIYGKESIPWNDSLAKEEAEMIFDDREVDRAYVEVTDHNGATVRRNLNYQNDGSNSVPNDPVASRVIRELDELSNGGDLWGAMKMGHFGIWEDS